jgi:hypothetical protein
VFAIVALVAFVGLVIDTGLIFIQYGRLRRSVDAAALAASLQYREGFTILDLTRSAEEFLVLNGINDPAAIVNTCDTDVTLCDRNGDLDYNDTGEQRKFVHVVARSNVLLAFMPVIGIRSVPLAAEAVSEAASVDVVLTIDRSESMTFDAPNGDPMRDPRQCNSADSGDGYPGECSPFQDVKRAAVEFVDNLFFPYDRVAIVTFDGNVHIDLPLDHCETNGLDETTDPKCSDQVINTIKNLSVFDPEPNAPADPVDPTNAYLGGCEFFQPAAGVCRTYDVVTHVYNGFDCPQYHLTGDPSTCTTTNIGGGLMEAGNEFGRGFREESLWVVILLTDGAANSSSGAITGGNDYCPSHTQPFCRDDGYVDPGNDPDDRHCQATDNAWCLFEGGTVDVSNYNTDDYARDMADFVGRGQNALVFTIGLGPLVTSAPQGDPADGEELMEYAATVGAGIYYNAPSGSELRQIFAQIADNIAVRLTH